MESCCLICEKEFTFMERKFHLGLVYDFERECISVLSDNLPWWITDALIALPLSDKDLFPKANKRKVFQVLNNCAMQVMKNPLTCEYYY